MTFLPTEAPKTAAHRLVSLQCRAWLPMAMLLLALASVFIFGYERRDDFYRGTIHNTHSAKNLSIAENLSPKHQFLMFVRQNLNSDGKPIYRPYNRFPIGGSALIKLAVLPFGDSLSAKIYAARTLMLLFFAAAAVLAYLSLRRITVSAWIALTAVLLAFSSAYCLYYSDMISNEAVIDLFAVMLVFHGMALFEQEGRFRQLLLKSCIALFLGWHVYALLLPYIAFGLMRELIKTRSSASASLPVLCQLKHAARALLRSRYLTLGVVALLFGVSVLTINFTNEYFALNREVPLTELPSFNSMTNRIGVGSYFKERDAEYLSWPAFPERQFYRVGMMTLPYAFSLAFVESREPPRLFVGLGIAASGASLIGLLFARRHKILPASLALSGFCWALPMRHNAALPWHSYEAVFYIGVALTLFSLILLYLIRLSNERVVAALSVAALLIFVISALRMSQLNNANQISELREAAIEDFEIIRNMTDDGNVIQTIAMPNLYGGIDVFIYYLSGRIGIYAHETAPPARTPDFVITGIRADGLASLTPQNRMAFLYERNDYHRHIDQMMEQAGEPLIRSDFDVHLNDDALIYSKEGCGVADTEAAFFLALFPVDEIDLPAESRPHGFHNLDFRFNDQAVRRGGRCIAITPLPDYDIARIYTGQFIQRADGSFEHLWEGDVSLTESAH